MAEYRLRVRTGSEPGAGTSDAIAVTLLGSRGRSARTALDRWGPDFQCGAVTEYRVCAPRPLGRLLLLRVHKGPCGGLPDSSWYLESVTVWGPRGDTPGDTHGDTCDTPDTSDSEDSEDSEEEEEEEEEEEGDTEEEEEDTGDSEGTGDTDEEEEEEEELEEEEEEDSEGDTEDSEGDTGDAAAGDPDDVTDLGPFHFPCYRWLQGYGTWDLPEGTARTPAMERHPRLQRQRRRYLVQQRRRYRLAPFAPGLPWALPLGTPLEPDLSFTLAKASAFYLRGSAANLQAKLRGFLARPCSWPSVEAMGRVFQSFHTPVTEYVVRHWQEDAFFGEQFLSGVNPVLLRRCRRLPPNFPVSEAVVAPSLGPATSLRREMEAGNIYLADYGVLQGIPTALIDGRPTFVAAPLCLLHQRPNGDLLPLAIQLSQEPGPSAPLFVPQDPPWLWALAKVWVRSAEFQVHEALTHLLRSHLLGEVFALATLRRLPPQHPLFKLLVPHTRFTVQIGALARRFLLNPGGVFDRAVALGRRGLLALVARGLRALRWRSLVLPRDLRHRGVAATKCHHFGCDATKVWRAIRRFVAALLSLYYPADGAVAQDSELQEWVREIFRRAFLGRPRSGVPSRLETRRDLVTFVTAVIFNCSALHAATNSGQFELSAFPPNAPAAMREPPPTSKAALSEQEFLAALPAMNTTATVLAVLWVLRNEPMDMRPLGHYPERHFTESAPRRLIRRFRRRLRRISRQIRARNAAMERPYPYLDPENIENSVAI
ncbi:polyunsaturated fatty acid lipoxygenase ALOX15B-like isoform X1 [Taeniopygia guttata]|uniref:polyunsaturated fatty acid lipoxygenase ALOX15B-like isoform X1 n=1 Tax=Taeniopygia guttata TaxID=59729 RepID=UPI003BB875EB